MSRHGNPYDNAKAESFMKTLKVEAVYLAAYETFEDASAGLPLKDACGGSEGRRSTRSVAGVARITAVQCLGARDTRGRHRAHPIRVLAWRHRCVNPNRGP